MLTGHGRARPGAHENPAICDCRQSARPGEPAVVAGAGGGIGRAIALGLVAARPRARPARAGGGKLGVRAHAVPCDMAYRAAVPGCAA